MLVDSVCNVSKAPRSTFNKSCRRRSLHECFTEGPSNLDGHCSSFTKLTTSKIAQLGGIEYDLREHKRNTLGVIITRVIAGRPQSLQ